MTGDRGHPDERLAAAAAPIAAKTTKTTTPVRVTSSPAPKEQNWNVLEEGIPGLLKRRLVVGDGAAMGS